MSKKKVLFKHRLEYSLLWFYILNLRFSPLFFFGWQKKIIYFLFKKINQKHSKIVSKNLKIAFPKENEKTISELKDKIYRHFSKIFTEIFYIYVKKKPYKILNKIKINNLEYLNKTLKKNKGILLYSAHFGNWELIPFILSRQLKTTIYSIAREMDNPLVEKLVKNFREYMGSTIIYKKGSLRTILKMLEKNNIIFLLMDLNTVPREGVYVDFFSKKTSTIKSVAQLHLKQNIPVVPAFLHYENDNIVLDILSEISYRNISNHQEGITQMTQKLTSIIENKIKEYPEQWFWFHNRWKTQPVD